MLISKQNSSSHATWYGHITPVILLILATVVLTHPLSFNLGDAVTDDADPLLNAWILAWDAHILPRSPLNLYNANDFYPYSNTLAYSETLLGQALFTLPIIWLTENPILAVNLSVLLSYALSGIGMYALTYRFTRSYGASFIAGMAFAFNPFRFAHIDHVQLLSAQWVPAALLFLDRLVHRPTKWNALGLTLFVNLQLLCSYYYALFFAVALLVLGLIYLITERQCLSRRLFALLVLSVVITAAIQIPLSIPYFRVAESMGFERKLGDAVRGGADLTDFITAPPENYLYGAATARWRSEGWWEHITFPGVTVVILALVGSLRHHPEAALQRARKLYLALALGMAILSLGPVLRLADRTLVKPMPYRLLFEYVPGFQAIRQPARFHMFTMVGLSVLAGLGTHTLHKTWGAASWHHLIVGLLTLFISVENLQVPIELIPVAKPGQFPPVYEWIAERPGDEPILELPILQDVGSTESPRLYYSTQHWKPMINGYGGFYPPTYAYFLFFDREFPAQPYDWIVGLGVRYVVIHRWQYPTSDINHIDRRLQTFSGLRLVADFDTDRVYEVIHPNTGRPNKPWTNRTWERKIRLLGFVAQPTIPNPGDTLEVKLFWQGLAEMDTDYTVFVHLVDQQGELVVQSDSQPQDGEHPTSNWRYEEVVIETRTLALPATLRPGRYALRVGFYDLQTMERLDVSDVDGTITGNYRQLSDIVVRSR